MPSIHPSIYSTRKGNTVAHSNNNAIRKVSSNNIFKQELSKFGDIIDHNILDDFLQQLSKQNAKEYLKADISPHTPSLSVIIKKKQTHTDFASYLHAACFSPARSTLATAIARNFFKTWPG